MLTEYIQKLKISQDRFVTIYGIRCGYYIFCVKNFLAKDILLKMAILHIHFYPFSFHRVGSSWLCCRIIGDSLSFLRIRQVETFQISRCYLW